MVLVVHQLDQAKARVEASTRQVAIVDEGLEVLLAWGLGFSGLETIRGLSPLLAPNEQALGINRLRNIAELPWPDFEDAIDRLSPEEKRADNQRVKSGLQEHQKE